MIELSKKGITVPHKRLLAKRDYAMPIVAHPQRSPGALLIEQF
jgi:hypothetical protein